MKYETVEPIDAKLNIWTVMPQRCDQFVTLRTFVVISYKTKSNTNFTVAEMKC